MAEDEENEGKGSNQPQPCSCKRSKIPVKSNSKTEAGKVGTSCYNVLVETKSQTTRVGSKLPIPVTSCSSTSKLKIKVRSFTSSDADFQCGATENDKPENTEPKICKFCDCDSGICNPECLKMKKERLQRFMSKTMYAGQLSKIAAVNETKVSKSAIELNTDIQVSRLSKKETKIVDQYDENKQKSEEAKLEGAVEQKSDIQASKSVTEKKICEICKCTKPCNRDCEDNKRKLGEVKKVCEICKCTKPCKPDCEANKKDVEGAAIQKSDIQAAKSLSEKKICEICKCTKPCNRDCEDNKKKLEGAKPAEATKKKVCEICKCTKPCNADCEANKKNIEGAAGQKSDIQASKSLVEKNISDQKSDIQTSKSLSEKKIPEQKSGIQASKSLPIKKICEICKCTKPCNRDCEANKRKLEEENKICEFCKCTKPCNPDCEANKKKIEDAKRGEKICEVCKCTKPCNLSCAANKIKIEEEESKKATAKKVCEICKCKKPCNTECEANKKRIEAEENKVCEICKCTKPCNEDCEANKMKLKETPANKVCEVCKCTKPCNVDCEANKKKLEGNKICEICKCTKPCNEDCEANKKMKSVENKVCEICKCTKPCNDDCEANKKMKSVENKVCEICKCTKPCNDDCEANKKMKSVQNKVCEICDCALPCNDDCEANKRRIEEGKRKEASQGKVCEVCKCTGFCNKECEAEKKRKEESGKVCEICKCSGPCNKDCEAKKLKKSRVDEICKCISACMNEVETKLQDFTGSSTSVNEDLRKQYLENKKMLEEKICEICICTDECNDACLIKKDELKAQEEANKTTLEPILEEKVETEAIAAVASFNTQTCSQAELTEENKQKVCEVCQCAIGACHEICAELKKLREDISKPAEPVACEICECPPNPCNEVCLMTMSKSIETRSISVKTSTPTSTYADFGCDSDDLQPAEIKTSTPKGSVCDKKSTSELISELSSVINDINCSCKKAESISKKSKRCKQTESDMRLVIQHLQQKCKMKDIFIDAMICDLSERKTSQIFDKLLSNIATNTKSVCDFDRAAIANALPRPNANMCPVKSLKTMKAGDCVCAGSEESDFRILVVKIVGPSLLIRWTSSKDICVIGYNVYVDGKVRGKVFNRLRTSVLIDCLDMKKDMRIEVYAMTKDGRCEPPAVKVYSPCPC